MAEGVSYRLRIPEPHTHLLHVEVELDGAGGPVRLVMPSWTPGSYLLREFARHVWTFMAVDGSGAPLAWTKLDKGTWEIAAPADGRVVARYVVYANDLTARTSHLDASHAWINGASVFMYADGRRHEPHTLVVHAPTGWRATTALAPAAPGVFRAMDYDELVDSPLEIGSHVVAAWDQAGRRHRYAVWGRGNYDAEGLIRDTSRIIAAELDLFGEPPYREFTFFLHLYPGGQGGLEHRESCSLMADRWAFRGSAYEQFLALTAHEYFHVWNGKRIRPAVLGPFDYTRENYTRELWVVEGITTYYTDLFLRRAGLLSQPRYLEKLGEALTREVNTPGRFRQSLEYSSFDTWIRFYRPDETSASSQISYYQKGGLVALLLDLAIRGATAGARSLDDVMRLLWERHGVPDAGFPEGEVERVAGEVAGTDLAAFFDRAVRSTQELEYDRYLEVVGLRTVPAEPRPGPPGTGPTPLEMRTGLRLRDDGTRGSVSQVLAGSAAHRAGINAGDELVAVDGMRVPGAGLMSRMDERRPGDHLTLTLLRRDELVNVQLEVEAPLPRRVTIQPVEQPTPEQERLRNDWLRTVVTQAVEVARVDEGAVAG
ncbi:MAG TPA: PDZ domain-containing protein [Longimicrobium sp.]|nr:PDZ domain-containing protein [Longimicrobium sp.]